MNSWHHLGPILYWVLFVYPRARSPGKGCRAIASIARLSQRNRDDFLGRSPSMAHGQLPRG